MRGARIQVLIGAIAGLALFVLPSAAPAAGAGQKLLAPDLIAMPPEDILGPSTQFAVPLGVDAPLIVDGCFLDERIRKGAKRCLRFDGIVGNQGAGPLELAYGLSDSGRYLIARQRLFYLDGTYKDRFATRTEFHPTHAHFHVQDFYIATLWKSTERGGRLGKEPITSGDKNGFCPEDSEAIAEDAGPGGRHYSCFTEEERGAGAEQVVGISAGWKDIYGYSLPDQFVEISGVPDGYYALQLELDPNNVFRESIETNNVTCVVLRLEGTKAELLDPSITC